MPQTNTINIRRTSARAVAACGDSGPALSFLLLSSLVVGVSLALLGRAGWMSLI